jgi:hypothetical protein
MTELKREVFPAQLPVDPTKGSEAIYVSLTKGLFAPRSIAESFQEVYESYRTDKLAYLKWMMGEKGVEGNGVNHLPKARGGGFDIGLFFSPENTDSERLWIATSPLNDEAPKVGADTLYENIIDIKEPSVENLRRGRPNTVRPLARLATTHGLFQAEGVAIDHAQIFARDLPAFSLRERRNIARGDATAYSRFILAVADEASRIRHEKYGTGAYKELDIFGANIPYKALGGAIGMIRNQNRYEVKSFTGVNLGDEDEIRKVSSNYAGKRLVGDAAKLVLPPGDYTQVLQSPLARDLGDDRTLAIRKQQARALINWRATMGLMSAKDALNYIEELLDNGVVVSIANSYNEPLTQNVTRQLPVGDERFFYTDIVGVEGTKTGIDIGEISPALALIAANGVKNSIDSATSN